MRAKILWLMLCLLPSAGLADGIPANQAFRVPFLISEKAVPARAVVTVTSAGEAVLTVTYAAGDDIADAVYVLVRKTGPTPNPSPDPQPDPKPDPKPTPQPDPTPTPAKKIYAVIVEETAERSPLVAAVVLSPKVRAMFEADAFRLVDDDPQVSDELKPFIERSRGKPLPQLYLMDEKGEVRFEGRLPGHVEEMCLLVAKHRGAR